MPLYLRNHGTIRFDCKDDGTIVIDPDVRTTVTKLVFESSLLSSDVGQCVSHLTEKIYLTESILKFCEEAFIFCIKR